eukprot:363661-Chlamydomonas_euryale.AAC.5
MRHRRTCILITWGGGAHCLSKSTSAASVSSAHPSGSPQPAGHCEHACKPSAVDAPPSSASTPMVCRCMDDDQVVPLVFARLWSVPQPSPPSRRHFLSPCQRGAAARMRRIRRRPGIRTGRRARMPVVRRRCDPHTRRLNGSVRKSAPARRGTTGWWK